MVRSQAINYDEEAQLARYVWDHFQRLMTQFEREVGTAISAR